MALAVTAACTDPATPDAMESSASDSDATAVDDEQVAGPQTPDAPTTLEFGTEGDTSGFRWDPVDGADGYRLRYGDRDGPEVDLAIDRHICDEEWCVMLLAPSSAPTETTEVTVVALESGRPGPPSPPVTFVPPPTAPPPSHRPGVTVTREDSDGTLTFEFIETADDDAAAALVEQLEREFADDPSFVGADINGPIERLGATLARDPTPSGSAPEVSLGAADGGAPVVAVVELGDVDRRDPRFADLPDAVVVSDNREGAQAQPEADTHAHEVVGIVQGLGSLAGSAPDAEIRMYVPDPPDLDTLARAIDRAVDDGADVVNLSLSTRVTDHQAIEAVLARAERLGTLVVAGAGNHGSERDADGVPCPTTEGREVARPTLPASAATVLTVGAVGADGDRWSCSVEAPGAVLAQGVDVPVAATSRAVFDILGPLRFGTREASGTSYAAPRVAALLAVLLAHDPELEPADLRSIVDATLNDGQVDRELAISVADPATPGVTLSVHHQASLTRGWYLSLTGVVTGDRLVASGQLYTRQDDGPVREEHLCSSRDGTRVFAIDQTAVAEGRRIDAGDDEPTYRIAIRPAAPTIIDIPCGPGDGWSSGRLDDHRAFVAGIAATPVDLEVDGPSWHEDDVDASLYPGRCEPMPPQMTGGCDHPRPAPSG